MKPARGCVVGVAAAPLDPGADSADQPIVHGGLCRDLGLRRSQPGLAQCFPIAGAGPRRSRRFSSRLRWLRARSATFLGHSSFWIESAGGATAVTDFNGMILPRARPTS